MAASAGTTTIGVIVIGLAGFGLGWFVRGAYDGSTISREDSTTLTQSQVQSNVQAVRKVDSATATARQAEALANKVLAEIRAEQTCEPGSGSVSEPVDQQLRELAKRRAKAREELAKYQGGVRE